MVRVLLISHEPQAAPGRIGRILAERGAHVDLHVVLADPQHPNVNFPDARDYDAVIAFGSFANAHDASARVWVEPEVNFLRGILDQQVPYLGVCFGGQLLAEALGGSVVPSGEGRDEIGLVTFDDLADGPLPAGPWFTWHEDRMELPTAGVDVLARNENAIQLFRTATAAGTQFHPEADLELVDMWTDIGEDHIPERTSRAEILEELQRDDARLERNCRDLVDWFFTTWEVGHDS